MRFIDTATLDAGRAVLQVDLEIDATWYPAEGDGWNAPRIPAHYEMDGWAVVGVIWYHPDDAWTEIRTPPGSIASIWLTEYIERRYGDGPAELLLREHATAESI